MYEGQEGRRKTTAEPHYELILEGLNKLSTDLQTLDSKIAALLGDETTLVTAFNTLATEYGKISTDIKNLLIELKNGQPVDYAAEIAKIEQADATVNTLTTAVNVVTAQEESDDASVNPGGPSSFGEVPK